MAGSLDEGRKHAVEDVSSLLESYQTNATGESWKNLEGRLGSLARGDLLFLCGLVIQRIDSMSVSPQFQKMYDPSQDLSQVYHASRLYERLMQDRLALGGFLRIPLCQNDEDELELDVGILSRSLQTIQEALFFLSDFGRIPILPDTWSLPSGAAVDSIPESGASAVDQGKLQDTEPAIGLATLGSSNSENRNGAEDGEEAKNGNAPNIHMPTLQTPVMARSREAPEARIISALENSSDSGTLGGSGSQRHADGLRIVGDEPGAFGGKHVGTDPSGGGPLSRPVEKVEESQEWGGIHAVDSAEEEASEGSYRGCNGPEDVGEEEDSDGDEEGWFNLFDGDDEPDEERA